MGRSDYFKHVDDELKDINPTCIWGLFNGVGYRHWRYSMKRMLPYKGNHVKGHTIPSYDFEEHKRLLNEEEKRLAVRLDDLQVHQSTKKRSIKARLKNLLVHHSTKERKRKQKHKKYSSGYRLQRTYSIQHLEHPIYFIPGKKEVEKNGTEDSEFANVLEMLQVDKRLFHEILQNANDAKAKLMKSGSFPSAYLSKRRLKPSKLKDKQSVLKWEKFPAEDIRAVKLGRALSLVLEHTGEEESSRKSSEIDEYMLRKNAFVHRRSISLTESLDKYAVFFENNLGKEGNLSSSKSLKLRNEDHEIKAYKNIPRLFSRIRSLSQETSFADTSTGEEIALSDIDDFAGFSDEYTVSERNTDSVQQSCLDFASECSLEDSVAAIDDFQSAQGLENRCDNIDQESSFNNDELNNLEISKSAREDDTEIDYIKHILEFSGFIKEGLDDMEWHSSEQPLKPSLFDEACRPNDLERFIEDLASFYYYQLLFDLLNEELVHILSKYSTYYPKKLSYSCRIRAFPVGNHMLDEVCSDVGQLLNFKPGEKPSIDSIIDFNLRKDESWMNLQYESEFVALEVDHMIFEDLLNELVC